VSVMKSELDAEVTRAHSEIASVQDALQQMKTISDGLSQDKIDLNKTITQVHHFSLRVLVATVYWLLYICALLNTGEIRCLNLMTKMGLSVAEIDKCCRYGVFCVQ